MKSSEIVENEMSATGKAEQGVFILCLFFVGIVLSFIGYYGAKQSEHEKILDEVLGRTELYLSAFNREIEINIEDLQGIKSLFMASTYVDRDEFFIFAKPAVDRYSSIQAFEWVPKVIRSDRTVYEERAKKDGLLDFHFTQRDKDNSLVLAGDREVYYPVYYIEPYEGNEDSLGFDLASSKLLLQTLNQSRDTGKALASDPIALMQRGGGKNSILIFFPVYKGLYETVEERRTSLVGFALGVFRLSDIVEKAIYQTKSGSSGIVVELIFSSNQGDKQPIHLFPQDEPFNRFDEFYQEKMVSIAGKEFILGFSPSTELLASLQTNQPLMIFFGGFLITTIIAGYLYTLTTREVLIRKIIEDRTEKLKTSETRTRAILDTAVDAIIAIDEKGSIRQFNRAAEKLFGYVEEEVLGENVKILMPNPYHDEHDGYLERYANTKEPRIIGTGREVTGLKKDGSVFPMQLSVGDAKVAGGQIYVGVVTDITLRKNTEDSLLRAKIEAEESNRMKSEFLNVMSHELRTPLTVILGYLPLLKNGKKMPPATMIAEMATDMESSGQYLVTLINDLLDISKIEAGKLDLHIEELPAKNVVANALESLQHSADLKRITLSNLADDTYIYVDPIRIKQILVNLIGNAIKFTEHGGITVSVTKNRSGRIEVAVKDTGCGIAEEDLPFIFDKFQQVDSSSTRKTGGTGLGLAITRKLVQLHGGEVSVISELNKGSTFVFTVAGAEE